MRRIGERTFVFIVFFLVYALTASGDLIGDTELRWLAARRFLDTGWVDLPAGTSFLLAEGTDGKQYSFYGPGQSACLLPFVIAGRRLAAWLPFGLDADSVGQLLASLLFFPACGALAVTIVSVIARTLSNDQRTARWVAVAYGVATMHWHNSVNTYEESQVAVCALTALWALERDRARPQFRSLWLAFAALAVAMAFRMPSLVIVAPVILVYFIDALRRATSDRSGGRRTTGRTPSAWIMAALLGLAPMVLLLGLYNAARFGVPWETGYARAYWDEPEGIRLFATPLALGLAGLLLSPGKSVFLYNPVLLLAIPGWWCLFKTRRTPALAILASMTAVLFFHAKYTFWGGDLAWGPRYFASSMGFYALALIPVFVRYPRSCRVALPVLLAASVMIQVASIIYSFGLEYFQDRRHGTIPDAYVWRPAESQFVCRFRNIVLHVAGRPIHASTPPERERPVTHHVVTAPDSVRRLHVVNIFPFKARAFGAGATVARVLFAAWAAGFVALALAAAKWSAHARSQGTQ